MKKRITLWLVAILILCLTAFWFGKRQSAPVYDQNYLAIDRALVESLRAGYITNAIEKLDAMLELETLAAMHNRPFLDERDRGILDKTLERVARYRQQHPWVIDMNTNGMSPTLPSAVTWVEEQKQGEAFLQRFVVTK